MVTRYMPDRTRAWAESLEPDYAGHSRSGTWFCLLTWRSPIFGSVLWAVGYSDLDLKAARETAVMEMYKQRLEHDLHDQVVDLIH